MHLRLVYDITFYDVAVYQYIAVMAYVGPLLCRQ